MKTKKILVALVAMSFCGSMSAQSKDNSVYFQYNPMSRNCTINGGEDYDFKGFTLGYNTVITRFDKTPLFLEGGIALTYARYNDSIYDDDDEGLELTQNLISANIPVSLVYDWKVSDAVIVNPYAGLKLRANISGTEKWEYTYDEGDYIDYEDNDDDPINLFDKKEMGKDGVWKRIQLGWQIGCNVKFNNTWFLGLSYGTDLSEISKKYKFSTTSLTVGLCF